MTTRTPTAPEKLSAQQVWDAATKATAAAAGALQPARDKLAAAQEAVAAANTEVLQALTTKNPDPKAARDRIEKARAAIQKADDDVDWAILELQAVEAVHEQAHTDEQAARRAVTVAEYQAAHREWNDPGSREEQLLSALTSTIAELVPMINCRKDLHDRLAQELQHLPPEERPQLTGGRPITTSPTRLIGTHIADIAPEVADAIREGAAAAMDEQAESQRARRHG